MYECFFFLNMTEERSCYYFKKNTSASYLVSETAADGDSETRVRVGIAGVWSGSSRRYPSDGMTVQGARALGSGSRGQLAMDIALDDWISCLVRLNSLVLSGTRESVS